MGTITSADNGTNVPSDEGFRPGGDWLGYVVGGTTIDADLEFKTDEGNWVKVPDAAGRSDITAGWAETIVAAPDEYFRFAVVTATGTWDYGYKNHLIKKHSWEL